MSSQRSFKGQYKEFTLNLRLNDSNVLEIQALNPKATDNYAYAIDKTYLIEHPQFFNIIEEPTQLLQLIRSRFDTVRFEGGKLTVRYGNEGKHRDLSILLIRTPSDQGKQIAQLFEIVGKLTSKIESIGALDAKITELKEKDQRFDQKQEKLAALLTEQEGRIISGLKDVQDKYINLATIISNLKITDVQIQEQIKSLTTVEEQDKTFHNWVKDRLAGVQKEINANNKSLNQRIDELVFGNTKENYWTGYFEQKGQRYNMTFNQFEMSLTKDGSIKGSGQDSQGKFEIVGTVNGAAIFQKRYLQNKDNKEHIIYYYSPNPTAGTIEGTWSWFKGQVGKDAFKISKVITVDQKIAASESQFRKELGDYKNQIKQFQDRLSQQIKDREAGDAATQAKCAKEAADTNKLIKQLQDKLNKQIKDREGEDTLINQRIIANEAKCRDLNAANSASIKQLQDQQKILDAAIQQLRKDLDNLNIQQKQEWAGYYVANGQQDQMIFSQFCIVPKPGGQIKGTGKDTVGAFELVGVVGPDSVTANFEKRYIGKHTIWYFGKIIQNTIVEGTWSYTNSPAGTENNKFRIAPISRKC